MTNSMPLGITSDWFLVLTAFPRGLYTRVFTADGNFKADHLTPKDAADDVWLTEGEGFMTAAGPYEAHLKDATENARGSKRVSVHVSSAVPYQVTVRPLWVELSVPLW